MASKSGIACGLPENGFVFLLSSVVLRNTAAAAAAVWPLRPDHSQGGLLAFLWGALDGAWKGLAGKYEYEVTHVTHVTAEV